MGFLLDTNHAIYLINGLDKPSERRSLPEKNVIEKIRGVHDPIFICEASFGELYFGAACSARFSYNVKQIKLLQEAIPAISVDSGSWKLFGETKAELRKRGKTLSDIDLLIACVALKFDLVLVSNDKGFAELPAAFRVDNWA